MDDRDWLLRQFEAYRPHLRAVASRLLGSASEAEDALQETWLRLSRSNSSGVENLGGWLTTIVGRVCLNMLQSRRSRREEPMGVQLPDSIAEDGGHDPERQALLADSIGQALLVVVDTLTPAERLAFILHDMFALPFEEIAPIVERSPAAARQLASRARRRVQGATPASEAAVARHREIVDAFLAAAQGGDFDALVALLAPDVVMRADPTAVRAGASSEVLGAPAVAVTFSGRSRAIRSALVAGVAGAVWPVRGRPRAAFVFATNDGRIVAIDLIADPERVGQLTSPEPSAPAG